MAGSAPGALFYSPSTGGFNQLLNGKVTPANIPTGQPNAGKGPSTGNSSVMTNGGAGTTATDPNAVAYYNDVVQQLTAELNAARGQQGTGIANINNAFNQSQNELNQQESTAETGYNQQTAENGQQRESNLGTIASGANNAFHSLMALLGAGGSGVSSAARYTAPQDIAQNASQQRGQATQTFNSNNAAINTAENQTKQQYGNALSDLLTQKNNQTNSFLSGLLGDEANLEQQIGAAKINAAEYGGKNYATAEKGASNETNAVNSIEDNLNKIFTQYATPQFSVTPVQAAPANTSTYTYDPTKVAATASTPGTDSSFLPYLTSLKSSQPTNGGSILTGGSPATAVTAGAA